MTLLENVHFHKILLSDQKIKAYKPPKMDFIVNNGNVTIEDYNGKIADMSCGTAHNLVLTEDGKIFPCGAFQDGYFDLSSEFLINRNQKIIKDKEMQLSIPT